MKSRKALLFIFEGYCEFEIATAISMLRDTHSIKTCALENRIYTSEAGLRTEPDFILEEVNAMEYDLIIIPGGDLAPIANAQELFHLVESFAKIGKIVAAICSGPFVLAKAGLLKEATYTATLSKEQRKFLGGFNEDSYIYSNVVTAGNIVTAQGHAFVEFGIEVNKLMREVSKDSITFYSGEGNRLMEKDL
ncbi:DJ-1/PfpI family protein [Sutcliffiella rhizosphaerae]|uniref:DJ-1/PfpI domain-containing protein n=1 Tax=Sutcliffiella rhizosphaerae TaxID=2880967 RepID=A0ABM8YR39_9BACI|nr:DJ-1/PfpI family protein [Sutcliffiella rhizosphaerae]CAG9622463.1 hypothetical protein BACCIP111883_03254 [Sutcliffiella rhizosphaerae]